MPPAVQNSPARLWQQLPPTPPQVCDALALFWQTPDLHVVVSVHAAFAALHVPFTQHEPAPEHALFAQQACPSAPHAVAEPPEHTLFAVVVWPDATQAPGPVPTQQPPPPHFVPPAQQS